MNQIKILSNCWLILIIALSSCFEAASYNKKKVVSTADASRCRVNYPLASDNNAPLFKLTEIPSNIERRSDGLPILESNKDAKVAFFLDFDGGIYDGKSYGPANLDGDKLKFNDSEAQKIYNAYLLVVAAFSPFNVNITTVEDVATASEKWAWIIISDDYSRTGGEGWIDIFNDGYFDNGKPKEGTSIAGAQAVLNSRSYEAGYLLVHELGHNLGLNHAGVFKNGSFYEYSDISQSERRKVKMYDLKKQSYVRLEDYEFEGNVDKNFVGTFLGGRIYEDGGNFIFRWGLQTIDDKKEQDPIKIIGKITGFALNEPEESEEPDEPINKPDEPINKPDSDMSESETGNEQDEIAAKPSETSDNLSDEDESARGGDKNNSDVMTSQEEVDRNVGVTPPDDIGSCAVP